MQFGIWPALVRYLRRSWQGTHLVESDNTPEVSPTWGSSRYKAATWRLDTGSSQASGRTMTSLPSQSAASPVPAHDVPEMRAADTCHPDNVVAFLRGYSASAVDHFYTTDAVEMKNAIAHLGYSYEGITGHVFKEQVEGTVPLYRLYQPPTSDHFYTASLSERDAAVAHLGYVDEGVAAYIYSSQVRGSVPLLRGYSESGVDHFYTTSEAEMETAVAHDGYASEGITGYVLPA